MDKESIKSHVDDNMVDLLLAYGLLQSIIEIFSEAVSYDNKLENKYVNMIKVLQMLVDDVETCIKDLSGNLKELLITEEV
ncbi:hypothetical protein [Enterocloster lavalensis]|uniref:Uncharacterized protein n=1 Tax=Enterocloster lavalensis TaxID=460384 RepID=A0A1I0ITU4_9FIRM|nr:hypothetical protein [Enterocloster lavalensis]SEU00432.1 hypothetical protein SAMN05216313_12389 [Enterocloster lavalensis]